LKKQSKPINTLNEKSLHASLKLWYSRKRDKLEAPVDGYIIDIVRGKQLIEIQTRNFSALRKKLAKLTETHSVRLVYPIEQEKWIVKLPVNKEDKPSRRKSPKRGKVEDVFFELVSIPALMTRKNFSLEVILIQAEEMRKFDGRRAWRRKGWVTEERHLLDVVGQYQFDQPSDFLEMLPEDLEQPFTTADLAQSKKISRPLAQKMAYCLREMLVLEVVGKQGNAFLYQRWVD
jgi:hypothetical protein